MQTTPAKLPKPSRRPATCAWCARPFGTVIELIDHVDERHLVDKRSIQSLQPWTPTPEEVAAALDEMRPIINRFAARDRSRLDHWTAAATC